MSLILNRRLPILGRDEMSDGKISARRLLIYQWIWVAIMMATDGLLGISGAMLALGVGGTVAVIPHAIFSSWAFRVQGARRSRMILGHFFVGEALKLVVAGIMISAILVSQIFPPVVVMSGFISTVIFGQVVVPVILSARHN